jgi:hypothetical protein
MQRYKTAELLILKSRAPFHNLTVAQPVNKFSICYGCRKSVTYLSRECQLHYVGGKFSLVCFFTSYVSRDRSVGIATSYELDDPGIESR